MKTLSILLAAGLLSACAGGYNPNYYFSEIDAVNRSGDTITDLSVNVQNSPKSLSCDEVAQFAMCWDRFGRLFYPQQGIELSWTDGDGSQQSVTSNASIPAYYSPAFPLRLVLEIGEQGKVKMLYEQVEPGGRSFMRKG